MFPPTARPIEAAEEGNLTLLGQAMIDSGRRDKFGTFAGITYFGQFIDHDLTYDVTKLEARDLEPSQVPNLRSPRFDLDLLYGAGPALSPHLYDGDYLKIGRTAPIPGTDHPGGTPRDIARDENGTPLHADPNDTRNLENLLVMQIHLLFVKFHNAAVEQCHADAFRQLPLPEPRFERARQLVRWHYQWLVREYFLPEVCLTRVLREVWNPHEPRLPWAEAGFFIPAEFSLAAFRFGHSMVRREYFLNCHQKVVPLSNLMAQTRSAGPLGEDWLLEWGQLFPGLRSTHRPTAPNSTINTAIVPPLHQLDEYPPRQPNAQPTQTQPKELPVRTLLRGARSRLPSGEEAAGHLLSQGLLAPGEVLGDRVTKKFEMTNDKSGEVLASLPALNGRTPLYYYLLKEAEVLGTANRTLGPLGTRIVAETIETVLEQDPTSYLRTPGVGPNWNKPLWRFRDGHSRRIDSITALVQMLGDDLPQGCGARVAGRSRPE